MDLLVLARRFAIVALCLVAAAISVECGAGAASRQRLINVDRIFAPVPIGGNLPSSIDWAPDGRHFLYVERDATGTQQTHVYDVRTRRDEIFFRTKANGKGARPAPEFVWSPDSRRLAYLDDGDLWTTGAGGRARRRVARDADDPQWSPDGTKIAYVHANDVYAASLASGTRARYSFDSAPDVVNGDPDWAYSEELSMRHAYRWAPDSRRIAYLHFDQRPIAAFKIFDYLAAAGKEVAVQRYPLAGGRNSVVTLRVAEPGGGTTSLYSTRAHDDYLASVGWTPLGRPFAQILDRAQRRLRAVEFEPGGGMTTVESDRSDRWVDVYGAPRWLEDGRRFLFASARDGVESLYLGDRVTGSVRRLTSDFRIGIGQNGDGNGDDGVLAIDRKRGTVIVSAAYPSRSDETALEVPLSGGAPKALATGAGSHEFFFSQDARHYVRHDSTFTTPGVYAVGVLGGGAHAFARASSLDAYTLGAVERGTLPSKFGKLDYWMIKPPGFDPSKSYPVIMYTYGGPASPTTANGWDGSSYLYHQALAERGFIVFSVDGPGSQVDSVRSESVLYRAFGPGSLEGQLAGVDYLRTLPFVDAKRLGIWGWSFGGYETCYALTHAPQTWKVGVAVAPVTDWRFYDTIYTERYMGTPRDEPAAYARSSVIAAAAALRGRLLISHGTSDDNVHLANTIALTQAFVLDDRQVDLMLFPQKTHGIAGIPQRRDLFTHMLRYWQDHL